VTNQLARSVSFKDRLIRRNVRVIDSWLLLSLPAGGGRCGVICRWWPTPSTAPAVLVSRRGWYQATVSLLPPLQPLPYRGSHGASAWRVMKRDCSSIDLCSATC